ncbi:MULTISPECIES: universal stress protein [Nocardia]|uniref:Universal stress protein n=1 Tax=Nocardia implantans TaxID=3108168 RepID=A0ABU6AWT8_9NOCA|nr:MULTISPECIES: universal stress protein [unclassified Nocardia]MBF6193900.1 universal stress protein [Nocardia beijingensis]MEA3529361.1 universal stress protein [Nocardia sp. CDC192]MEB3511947.1 universal stress protein [Nocardia sp. CDC186]
MTEHSTETAGPIDPPLVVAVDGSATSYHAAAWAAADAALHRARLHIVTSVPVRPGYGPGATLTEADVEWLRKDGERVLTEAARVARTTAAGEALTISTELTVAPIIPDLIDRSRSARMLVVGSRGLGAFRRELLGSVSTAMTRHAHCPVAVVRSTSATDAFSSGKPVLVGVDGTTNSVPAVELAFDEASRRKVGLIALHAWSDSSGIDLVPGWDAVREREDALLAENLAGCGERYPDVAVRRVLVRDRPVRSLLDQSDEAQLLVVGSHGRGGFTGMLLGSTSAALLHSVECPIIVVRQR